MEVLNLFPHKGKSISDTSSTTLPCQATLSVQYRNNIFVSLGRLLGIKWLLYDDGGALLSLSLAGGLSVTGLGPVCY